MLTMVGVCLRIKGKQIQFGQMIINNIGGVHQTIYPF